MKSPEADQTALFSQLTKEQPVIVLLYRQKMRLPRGVGLQLEAEEVPEPLNMNSGINDPQRTVTSSSQMSQARGKCLL